MTKPHWFHTVEEVDHRGKPLGRRFTICTRCNLVIGGWGIFRPQPCVAA